MQTTEAQQVIDLRTMIQREPREFHMNMVDLIKSDVALTDVQKIDFLANICERVTANTSNGVMFTRDEKPFAMRAAALACDSTTTRIDDLRAARAEELSDRKARLESTDVVDPVEEPQQPRG